MLTDQHFNYKTQHSCLKFDILLQYFKNPIIDPSCHLIQLKILSILDKYVLIKWIRSTCGDFILVKFNEKV